VPIVQDRVLSFVMMVKSSSSAADSSAAVRGLLAAADPDIPVTRVMTLQDRIDLASAGARFSATVMSMLAGIALALAAVGVYGVLSYTVSQRHREFGVRAAVGATRGRLIRMVLGDALLISATAIPAGLAAAALLRRVVANLLFEIPAGDPVTLTAVGVVVAAVTVAAALAPAWRAAAIDPMVALRDV